MRTSSRASIYVAGVLAVAALAAITDAKPASAMIIYPWCGYYGGRDGGSAPNCGFVSFQQCMATVSGTQGTCKINPWYDPPKQQRKQTRRTPDIYVPRVD